MERIVQMRFSESHQHPTQTWECACHGRQEQPIVTCIGKVLSLRHALAITLSLGGAHAVHGADASVDQSKERSPIAVENPAWSFQVTPYIWAAGLKGNISPFRRAPKISARKSFSDVMDDLNFGGFINVWGRHGRFVFSGDIM